MIECTSPKTGSDVFSFRNTTSVAVESKRLKILVGTFDTGLIPEFADGFRELGHDVTTVCSRRSRIHPDYAYDVDISAAAADLVPWSGGLAQSSSWIVRAPRGIVNRCARLWQLLRLMWTHDVFFFICGGHSLTLNNREYALLKSFGKRLVTGFMGGDCRNILAFGQQYNTLPLPDDLVQESLARNPDHPQLRHLRMAEYYSDLVLSVPNQASLAVRPYRHFFIPLDMRCCRFQVPGREVPVVVHAPSNKNMKGTERIVAALERLRAEGVAFELRLLQGVSNEEVRSELAKADVVVDQLYFFYHGRLGTEAMASGCALASSNEQECEPYPANRPVWHIDNVNIEDRLRRLLTDRELRLSLAHRGRAYVEKNHDHVAVAGRIAALLTAPETETFWHYPTFYAEQFVREGWEIRSYLKRMTATVIRRWGLPAGASVPSMVRRGLLPADMLKQSDSIPRWGGEAGLGRAM